MLAQCHAGPWAKHFAGPYVLDCLTRPSNHLSTICLNVIIYVIIYYVSIYSPAIINADYTTLFFFKRNLKGELKQIYLFYTEANYFEFCGKTRSGAWADRLLHTGPESDPFILKSLSIACSN